MADITMPQLGETVTEGTITRWTKAVGDQVSEDEVLYEVSTDKVDSEVPSPSTGYVAEILVPEGETVAVGTVLARISDQPPDGDGSGGGPAEADNEAAPAEAKAAPEPEPEAEEPEGQKEMGAAEAEGHGSEPGQDEPEQPEAEQPKSEQPGSEQPGAEQPRGGGSDGETSGDGGRSDGTRGSGGGSMLLSPVVRRLIAEHNLDPAQIKGTGVGGRITRSDVLKLVENGGGAAQPKAGSESEPEAETGAAPGSKAGAEAKPGSKQRPRSEPQPEPAAAKAGAAPKGGARPAPAPAPQAGPRDEVIPFSRIRRVTAEHMVRSKSISPHTVIAVEVDYSAVEKVRRAKKDAFRAEEGVGLTYLPFVARAVVDAISEFPHVNSSVGDDELIVHRYVDMGIAVDLDFQGLLVPVIRDAHDKRLRPLARQIGDLAAKARSKKLSPDDLVGGTFTLTNAGPFGTFLTIPVINQPQTAILSTDGVKKKPVAVALPDGSDGIAVHPVGILALTFDHRAFDGAYAAAFVAKVKEILETRDWSAEV